MTADGDNARLVKDAIEALREAMEAGIANLRSDVDKLRCEFKSDIAKFDHKIKVLKHSLSWTQEDAARLKEQAEKNFTETNAELAALRSKIDNLELRLNEERENNIRLEQHIRRENLRFNNIKETSEEDYIKTLVDDIMNNVLGINTSKAEKPNKTVYKKLVDKKKEKTSK